MILKAMKELHVGKHIRLGITAVAVGNYIRTNYPVKENYRRFLRVAFQKALEEGLLTRDGVYYRTTRKARSRIRTKPRYNRKRKSSDSKSSVPSKRSKKATEKKKSEADNTKIRKFKQRSKKNTLVSTKRINNKKQGSRKGTKAIAKESGSSLIAGSVSPKFTFSGSKFDHVWQYKNDSGNWGMYDMKASDILEQVYQKYLLNRSDTDVRAVKSGSWEYQVDFLVGFSCSYSTYNRFFSLINFKGDEAN